MENCMRLTRRSREDQEAQDCKEAKTTNKYAPPRARRICPCVGAVVCKTPQISSRSSDKLRLKVL
uniref:Uncharacterized protein n=1 Tax=Salix viminalis TaxID=40686 RepID=A0A6N2K2G3_SALVM